MKIDARLALNFLLFQVGWFACVLGGASDLPAVGTTVVGAVVAIHLFIARNPVPELVLILLAGAIGTFWDSLLVAIGLISYPSGTVVAGTAPHWIIAMWMLFATTLNVSMLWLRKRYWLAALLGGIGGPLAYYTGFNFGGVMFADFRLAMAAQSVGWAVLMPLLVVLASRFDGIAERAEPAFDRGRSQVRSGV